ncbi:unnamed protein product [Adineta steineri]|uniref:Uncharacterized protein n=1 Tax=Adineta steineri TaxID=433720 RepID=A0A819A0A3_9BILA|nr:unnamed protein product [Adineta steineri]
MTNQQSNIESIRSIKANEQRLKSLEDYEREKQNKKRLIKDSSTVNLNKKTHYTFDSDNEDGDGNNQPKEFIEKKIKLFDDNDELDVEEHFSTKKIPKKKRKLQDLQARLTTTSDPRFQFSEQFLDERDKNINDDEEKDDNEEEINEVSFEEEKNKSLAILDQITNAKNVISKPKPKTKMIRFDPSKTEHRIYEINSEVKLNDDNFNTSDNTKPKSILKRIIGTTPILDSKRTYDFDETKLKTLFDKTADSTNTSNGNGQFQFQFFNNQEPVTLPAPKIAQVAKPIANGKSKLFLNKSGDTSSEEDDDEKQEQAKLKDQLVNDTFFFFDIDVRLKDGLEGFVRTEDLNELERTWPTKRKEIGEALRTKHRKAIQRKDKHRVFNHRHRQRQQPSVNSINSKTDID